MKVRMGKFSEGYAWFITDENGMMVAQGYNEDLDQARQDARAEKMLRLTHDIETE